MEPFRVLFSEMDRIIPVHALSAMVTVPNESPVSETPTNVSEESLASFAALMFAIPCPRTLSKYPFSTMHPFVPMNVGAVPSVFPTVRTFQFMMAAYLSPDIVNVPPLMVITPQSSFLTYW